MLACTGRTKGWSHIRFFAFSRGAVIWFILEASKANYREGPGREAATECTTAAPPPMPGCCSVCVTLLRRKEALLKANRCCSSICEIVIPILLSAIVLVGALISDRDKFPTELFVPDNSTIAFQDLSLSAFSSPRSLPTFVPPLPLFLAYAALLNSALSPPGRALSSRTTARTWRWFRTRRRCAPSFRAS